MFHRVLVPLDSTPLSRKVLDSALRCTNPEGELVVLRVQAEAINLESADCKVDLDVVDQQTTALLRRVTAVATEVGQKCKVRAEVRSGPLVGTILETATELESDLIVMGTHGRKGLTEQVTGSPTERIVAKASASVFVVKAAGYPFLQD